MAIPGKIMAVKKQAIFLDKDGTLIPDIPYNVNPELITLSRGSVIGLKRFMEAGYLLILVSNQSGVAYSYFHEHALIFVEKKISALLRAQEVLLSDFYYCPHHPKGIVKEYKIRCSCRKPKPGLLVKAAEEHHIDLSRSWMIGDILNDIEAGNKAGCKTILINNGNESEWHMNDARTPDCMVSNINEAADYILKT